MYDFTLLKSIYRTTPLEYKGFKFKYIEENVVDQQLHCIIQKDGYIEQVRDEHGRLKVIRHDFEQFDFNVDQEEFILEQLDPIQVIWIRFKAEVDYYLGQKTDIKADDYDTDTFNYHKPIRKYYCQHCGTEYTTSESGYTPTCTNCGARMIAEPTQYNKIPK